MMIKLNDRVYTYDYQFKMGGGLYFPARCSIVKNEEGLTLISPGPFHEAVFNQIHTLGTVKHIVAPNSFHHSYLNTSIRHFPGATVYMHGALSKKYPGHFHAEPKDLLRTQKVGGLDIKQVQGHKALSETVFYEAETKTLILTDLLFNIKTTKNMISNLVFKALRLKGQTRLSPLVKYTIKDKSLFTKSLNEILNWDIQNIVMAHGEPITQDASRTLQAAWNIKL